MQLYTILLALATSASAIPTDIISARQSSFNGVATFNDYQLQGPTVCNPGGGIKSPLRVTSSGTSVWGAAAGDLSAHISKGTCTPWDAADPMSTKNCSGTTNVGGYQGPNCNMAAYCGTPTCYRVTSNGGFNRGTFNTGAAIPGGKTITVQIIDVCPTYHAQNYCAVRYDMSPNNLMQHCESSATDSLDIDTNAYGALTGKSSPDTRHDNGDANLNISIEPLPSCP